VSEPSKPCIDDVNKDAMITVLLVEDEPWVRKGLRMLLTREPDMTIVGEVSSRSEALALIQPLRPNVVLMDTAVQDMDGIGAMAALPGSALVPLT
jgi:DNA-binding NarL/FixJ family response regulator